MPAFLLTALANPKAWGAVGVALALALLGLQTARLSHAKHDLTAARTALIDPATRRTWQAEAAADLASLATARQAEADLAAALSVQNQAVAALKTQGDAATASALRAVQAARSHVVAAQIAAARILAARPGPDGCASADQLILQATQGAQP